MKILIAIPCYRCEKQIPRVLLKLAQANFLSKIEHVALIDNRSPDETVKSAQVSLDKFPLLNNLAAIYQNEENYGLGGTHKVAFDLSAKLKIDYVFILHGDDQAEVEDIGAMLTLLEREPLVDAILGSRFSRDSKLTGYQKKRIVGNIVLNIIYSLVTFRKTSDLGSGLNLYSLKEMAKIPYHELSSQFNFNAELLLSLYKLKSRIIFCPITWKEEDQQSNAKNFSVALRMLRSLFFWRFLKLPKEAQRDYNFSRL